MRKVWYLLIISFIIFIFNIDCHAFSKKYNYNYEVTNVTFDGQLGTIEGWAILNAGVTDGSSGDNGSPSLQRKYESTSSKPYKYSLKIYAINSNGGLEVRYINGKAMNISKQKSLTGLMCWRNTAGSCVTYKSPYYEKVKFKFSFDFAEFNDSTKYHEASHPNEPINGYKFVLTVKSTKNDCTSGRCTETFPLTFLKKAVSESARQYFDSSTYMEKLVFIANSAYVRTKNCSKGSRIGKIITAGGKFKIYDSELCSSKGVTYYKIQLSNGKKGWVPASWIAPPKGTYTMIINDVCNVDGTQIKFEGVENEVEAQSCDSIVSLVDTANESCITQDSTEYYKITCEDKIDTTFVPSKMNYYRGDDFEIDVTMTSRVSCVGTFDHVKWLNNYNTGDESTKANLKKIKDNFINYTMNAYDVSPSGNLTYTVGGSQEKINLFIKEKRNLSEVVKNIEYTNSTNNIPKKLTYTTNVQEVKLNLINPIVVDAEKENTPYNIRVQNAGFSAKTKVNFSCEIVKKIAVYRSVDVKNPFISSDRVVGDNWKNEKYDFTKIIDEEIWSKPTPEYVFFVSTNDIKKIRNDNNLSGIGGYFGSNCNFVNKEYRCSFIRNTNFFTNIIIKGEKVSE